ncbi:MAG: choice-of-anchor D domain-containing protein, partial [Verrucomicrobia bacterium]|nr:choice-of-anchor D domain-containing protein [Verrucomicrobiota bacterium]
GAGTFALGGAASLLSSTISVASGATFDVSRLSGGWTLPSGGTLSGTGTTTGTLTIAQGATLLPFASGTFATLTTGALNLNGTIDLRIGSGTLGGAPSSDKLVSTGALTLGLNSVLNLLDGGPSAGVTINTGTFTLATSALALSGTFGTVNFVYNPDFNQTISYLSDRVVLTIEFNGVKATWKTGAGLWNAIGNWDSNNGFVPGAWVNARGRDTATFDNTGTPSTITLDTLVQLKELNLNTASGTGYSFVASGTSQFSLYGMGADAKINVLGGTHSIAAPVYLESDLAVSIGSADSVLTLAGSLSESSSLGIKKTGLGTLKMAAANLYSGTTQISAGALVVTNAAALGSGAVLVNGGLLDVSAAAVSGVSALTFSSGSLNLGVGNTFAVNGGVSLGGTINVSGSVADDLGRYSLITSTAPITGTYVSGTLGLASSYYYLKTAGNGLNLQRRATLGTISAAAVGAGSIITGGTALVNVTVFNSAPVNSDDLLGAIASSGSLSGSSSFASIIAGGSGVSAGLVFNGTSIGPAQLGTFIVTGSNTTNSGVAGTVSVNVYDHAIPSTSGTSFLFSDVIVGYTGSIAATGSVSVSNATGYRSDLKTTGTVLSGGVSINNISGVVAGGSGQVFATLAPGKSVGAFTQNFTLTLADDSTLNGGSSNLGTWALSASGTVYDHASPVYNQGTLTLVNVREGYTSAALSTGSLSVTNGTLGALRVALRGAATSTGFVSLGSFSGITAGGSAAFGATLATGRAVGAISETLTLTFADDSALNGANAALSTGLVNVVGGVYRLAVGSLASSGTLFASGDTLTLGIIREGQSFTARTLDVLNVAAAGSYSESLDAAIAGTIGMGSGSGSVNLLTAGGTAAGALALGLGSGSFATAGVQTGTVNVAFLSNGTGTSGLGTASAGTQTVKVSGTVYRLAVGSLGATTFNLGAVREGGALGTGTLSVYNIAAGTDSFSEKLNVLLGGVVGDANIVSGSLNLLAAGSSDLSTLKVGLLNTGSAGAKTGTVTVNYKSDGTGTSGLAEIGNGSATLTLSGAVYRLAAGSLSTTVLSLGTIRAGGSVGFGSLTLTNSAGDATYTDLLGVSSSSSAGFTLSGGSAMLSGGSSSALSVGYDGSTLNAGALSGTLTLTLNSIGQ